MNPKQLAMLGALAFAITIGGVMSGEGSNSGTNLPDSKLDRQSNLKDDFIKLLGASSDEEVYYALYNGKSLADIAKENNADIQKIINLQIAELTEQLNSRLAAGMLTPEMYQAQMAEIPEIITRSVYGIS